MNIFEYLPLWPLSIEGSKKLNKKKSVTVVYLHDVGAAKPLLDGALLVHVDPTKEHNNKKLGHSYR